MNNIVLEIILFIFSMTIVLGSFLMFTIGISDFIKNIIKDIKNYKTKKLNNKIIKNEK